MRQVDVEPQGSGCCKSIALIMTTLPQLQYSLPIQEKKTEGGALLLCESETALNTYRLPQESVTIICNGAIMDCSTSS